MKKLIKKYKWREKVNKIIYVLLLVSLIAAFAYAIVGLVFAPMRDVDADLFRAKGDYLLPLFQSLCGLFAMYLPNIIEKRWKIQFPTFILKVYILFLYASIVLGEFRNFYYIVPHWDTMLHTVSGIMLALFGYSVITLLNNSEKILLKLSPVFVAVFTFCFAVSLGAIWEIFEFSADAIIGTNMQKFALEDGTLLIGKSAVTDTMKDLIVDAIGALAISLLGYFKLKEKKSVFRSLMIKFRKENKMQHIKEKLIEHAERETEKLRSLTEDELNKYFKRLELEEELERNSLVKTKKK